MTILIKENKVIQKIQIIPLQEVAILKQTLFRKAECGKKLKTINSKHDAIRSVLLCAFSCEEVLTQIKWKNKIVPKTGDVENW